MSFIDLNTFWDHYVKDTTHSGNISYWDEYTSMRKIYALIQECVLNLNTECVRNLNISTTRLRHKRGQMLVTKMITHFYLLPRKTVRRKDRKVGKRKEQERISQPLITAGPHLHITWTFPLAAQAWEAVICSFCFLSIAAPSNKPKQW